MNPCIKTLFVASFVLTIFGCATEPTYKNVSSPDAVPISGGSSQNETCVKIETIDGVPTGKESEFTVAPGPHELAIYAGNDQASIRDRIVFRFLLGAKYKLVVNHQGAFFHFRLLDLADSIPQEVASFKLRHGPRPAPPPEIPTFEPPQQYDKTATTLSV